MHIRSITAGKEEIRFFTDAPVSEHKIRVSLFPAAIGEEGELCSISVTVTGESFSIPRRLSGRDGLTCRYVISDVSGEVTGKKYVELLEDAPAPSVPTVPRRGAVIADPEDVSAACDAGAVFVNLSDLLMPYPAGENTVYFRMDGEDYYLRKQVLSYLDACIRPLTEKGIPVTLVLLNAREWLCTASDRFWDTVRHPGGDVSAEYVLFDTVRARGCGYFTAFVSFLAERYRPDGMVIGYDVNTAAENAAAGEMPVQAFAEAYITALRTAYQYTAPYGVRIYAAVDESFDAPAGGAGDTYSARDLLSALAGFSLLEGEVPFGIAVHPGDDPCVCAQKITEFLARPEMLWGGAPRRVILMETDTDEPLPDTVDGVFAPAEE